VRHLKRLAPDVSDDVLRIIWSRRLPPHFQTILPGQAEGNLDTASQLADRIAVVAPLPTTASVTQAPDHTSLLQNIENLSLQVAALTSGRTRHPSHSRDRRKSNNSSPPAHGPADRGYCRYHRRFGDEERKCTPPCSFRQHENGSDRR
jgi:hypothetical protein